MLPIYCELELFVLGTGGHFGISEFVVCKLVAPPYLLFLLIGARRSTLVWEFKFLNELLVYVLLKGLLTIFDKECSD